MQTVTSAENGGTEKADFQVPIQWLSKRFLDVLIVSDSTTESGSLFQATGAR